MYSCNIRADVQILSGLMVHVRLILLIYLFKYCELVCIVLFVGCRSLAGVTVSGVVRKQVGGAPSRAG